MRSAETPYWADLFAISFRWMILFGLIATLGLSGNLDVISLIVLGLTSLWNMFNTIIASVNRRLLFHRPINLVVDVIFTILLFIVTGGISGPILWVGALAVSSASVYYLLPGALLVAVLISFLETGYVYFQTGGDFSVMFLGIMVGVNLVAGLITGILSNPLIRRLRSNYQGLVTRRKEVEVKVQRTEHDRMKALFELTETMSGTLNYHTVLDTALDGSITALGLSSQEQQGLISTFLLFQDDNLKIFASRGFPPRDMNVAIPADGGILHEVLTTGSSVQITDARQDSGLVNLACLQDNLVVFCIPLIRGLNAFGVLLFAHPDQDFFNQDRREMLEMVSNQAVVAIQNARLFQDLAMEKERIVTSQEEAQKKLARDLHDGPTQSVSAIAMRLSIARRILLNNPDAAAEEIQKVEELARRTTQEIRHMLFTLRPLILETEGLTAAIKTIADKMRELYQQNVVLDINEQVAEDLDQAKQTVVFALTEEAVNNARKHAEASEILVRLKQIQQEPPIVVLEIADDGKGFDYKEVMGSYERRGSLGMINLKERSELINALLKIDSAPGKGTRIRVFIPLSQQAIDLLHRIH
jgi:signal transduction histidine kinase